MLLVQLFLGVTRLPHQAGAGSQGLLFCGAQNFGEYYNPAMKDFQIYKFIGVIRHHAVQEIGHHFRKQRIISVGVFRVGVVNGVKGGSPSVSQKTTRLVTTSNMSQIRFGSA
jgi:hypothetical protein